MSRETATKEMVRAARELLLADGVTPTQRNVHALTGGSMTRINQFMKELDAENRIPGLRIQERLGALVNELHAELQKQAKDTAEKEAAKNQKVVDAARADLAAVQEDYAGLKKELAAAQSRSEALSQELASTIAQLNRAHAELAAQAERLTATQQAKSLIESRASKLEENLAKTEDTLVAYQHYAAEEREKSSKIFESALEGLKVELREARNQVSTANLARQETTAQNLILNRDAERLSGEVGRLGKKVHELEESLRTESATSDNLRETATAQKIATASAEGQILLLTKQLEDCSSARNSALEQLKSTQGQLQEATHTNAELLSQNELLKASATKGSA